MAHFAMLNEENKVINVVVVDNEVIMSKGTESELLGIQFLKDIFGQETIWKQTSYNSSFRKNYACIAGSYDPKRDAFIPPQVYPSWILNEEHCKWEPPFPAPQDGNDYIWDESVQDWIILQHEV